MQAIDQKVYTVSQLNKQARGLVEAHFSSVWISGEVSNLSRPSSGHLYFSLKDQGAQVRCALFRMSRRYLNCELENGQQVLVKAQVSLYEPRGDFQLIVSRVQLAGDGALQMAFEQLKKRLDQEGLFSPQHKQALPLVPKTIGVITSSSGAAIRDILIVLKRRFAGIPVIIYPTLVQGKEAAPNIVTALETANRRRECDVLIVARGGGSLEDLWPFNEEAVARAIYASDIPIVSGIGHEVDTTIADFVADQRAATPSAAAELVSPNQTEWLQTLLTKRQQLQQHLQKKLQYLNNELKHLTKRLQHPGQRLRDQAQQLDRLEQRLMRAQHYLLDSYRSTLQRAQTLLQSYHPQRYIDELRLSLSSLTRRHQTAMQNYLQITQQKVHSVGGHLDALSPLKTLDRGYAIVQKSGGTDVIRCADDVTAGDRITTRLADGTVESVVV